MESERTEVMNTSGRHAQAEQKVIRPLIYIDLGKLGRAERMAIIIGTVFVIMALLGMIGQALS